MNVIDLSEHRNARERPDPAFIRHDDFGREMYRYLLDYEFESSHWGAEVWAYSMEEAEARVAAMRVSLSLCGQTYTRIPG